MKFIDLCCGVGGFHQAVKRADPSAECVFACDIDKNCRKVYETNYGVAPHADIFSLDVNSDIPPHDLLCAGFPCQAFSVSGFKRGFDDPRGQVFMKIAEIFTKHKPEFMIFENVLGLLKHDNGNTFNYIKSLIITAGYAHVSVHKSSPHYFGIPQRRERIIILCKKSSVLPPLPPRLLHDNKAHRDYKGTLFKDIVETEPDMITWPQYKKDIKYYESILDQINDPKKRIIEATDHSRELRISQKSEITPMKSIMDNPDIIIQVRPSGMSIRSARYCQTITSSGDPIVYTGKKITPRTAFRLQSFPEDFVMDENKSRAYKQAGNAVNVHVIYEFIKYLLQKEDDVQDNNN